MSVTSQICQRNGCTGIDEEPVPSERNSEERDLASSVANLLVNL